ncbi:MAG: energy transducer TonB [Terracidiphilus sp.]
MVPPEELEKEQPATLPADFGEWDSGDHPEPQAASFNGFEAVPIPPAPVKPVPIPAAPAPPLRPVTARVTVAPPPAQPAISRPASAPPPRPPAKVYPEPEPYYPPRRSNAEYMGAAEDEDEPQGDSKRKMILAGIGSLVLLVALGSVGYFKFHTKAPAAPTTTAVAVPGTTTLITPSSKPTAATAATPTATSAPAGPAMTEAASTETAPADASLRSQTEKMNHQLNAPSKISSDLQMLAGKDAAPSAGFGGAGGDTMNAGNVFAGQSGPKVRVASPQKVTISNGVAVGLLVQKTAPVYPAIARTARVSGTVVIQATISRNGTIENSHVISGPTMLRQAAQDAVRTWRFRPYLLDGEPVEVETTVNVVFNLGG